MPPYLALTLCAATTVFLLKADRLSRQGSWAIWLPLLYFLILATRLPAQWLSWNGGVALDAVHEGSPLDRAVYLALLFASLFVLVKRGQLFQVTAANLALCAFLVYSLASVVWSDYPLISWKRWVRDLAIYTTIAVALSYNPEISIRVLFRRFAYVTIPLSVVLVKYFPHIGRGFSAWTGEAFNVGAAVSKNGLGAIALICSLYLIWDLMTRAQVATHDSRWTRWAHVGLLGWALWLMWMANSSTALLCLVAGMPMLAMSKLMAMRSRSVGRLFITGLVCFVILDATTPITDLVLAAVGRESTLTGRTDVWTAVLAEMPSPVIGVGYESFWLGERLERMWQMFPWAPNQAHNGYIELYLNLGAIGVLLGAVLLVSMYLSASAQRDSGLGRAHLGMCFLFVFLLYNVTEAAFKSHPVWFTLLAVTMSAGRAAAVRADSKVVVSPRRLRPSRFRPAAAVS